MPLVADFLTEKFQAGLQQATVANYKSAILSIHRGFEDGSTINSDGYLSLLLDGMFNERPPNRKVVPPWDLNTVLDYLKGHPFEPLQKATLKYVTLKTAFLLALASGRRCSELHAVSKSASVFTNNGATLFLRPDFLAKNERGTFRHSSLSIPRIGQGSSVAEDRLWCPVRALQHYLYRTQALRGTHDRIFITHAEPHGPAAKQTLSRWLVQVLVDSGAIAKDSHPTAHSTRSISSSWAYHRGVPLEEICQAVSWKSPSSFSSVYYRNVANQRAGDRFTRAVLGRQ